MSNGVFRGFVFAAPLSLCLWGVLVVVVYGLSGN